jgi:signal transduction histidine kinase/CheY-like chemotaxis protein/PAS domain-containing protein
MTDVESSARVRALEALARVTDRVAHATEQHDICEGALDELEYAIGARRSAILLFDDAGVMRFCGARGISAEYKQAAEGHSPWSPDDRHAEPIVVPDALRDASLAQLHEALQREHIAALAFIPMIGRESVIGKFMIYWDQPHDMSSGEMEAARGIAERVGLGIERLRAPAALRASRDQLDSILRGIIDGVTVLDRSGRIVFANPAAARLIGVDSVEELLRTPSATILDRFEIFDEGGEPIAPADLPGHLAFLGRIPPSVVVRFRVRSTGEERWWNISAAPIFGADGQVLMAISIFRDITEARHAQERERFLATAGEILASSLDYETTMKSVAHLAVPGIADWCRIDVIGPSGVPKTLAVVHRDPAKLRWAEEIERRYPPQPERSALTRIVASGKSEMYPEVKDEMLRSATEDPEYLEILRSLGLRSAMMVPLTARGRTFGAITLIASESPRRFNENDLAFAEDLARRAALAIDNAELYRQEQEARQREADTRAEAEAANRAKDDFLATVSHELRTPLTAILGWSRMLTTMSVDEETRTSGLVAISRAAEMQARIIDDLLDVSRIITGKLRLEVRPVALSHVVNAALDAVRHAASAKHITLDVDAPDIVVRGDADRLQQVLWNLLSNAVKFTPDGGRVSVRAERSKGNVCITVSDTGAGISPDLLRYVFDRFRQADSSATRAFGGLGLGLSIVRSLVEMHGGLVNATSEGEGRGATFTVTLPLFAAAADSEKTDSMPVRGLNGRRILLVENDDETRQFLDALLTTAGADVRAAASVSDAIRELDHFTPHAVVTDIAMPDQDGYALLDQLRKRASSRNVPAIAVTAYGRPEDRERAMRAGFISYVRKPVDPDAFIQTVASVAN